MGKQVTEVTLPAKLPKISTINKVTSVTSAKLLEVTEVTGSTIKPSGTAQSPLIEVEAAGSNEWLTTDCLRDMATALEECPNSEALTELRQCWPPFALNAACKLLKPETHKQIMRWVLEQNVFAEAMQFATGARVKVGNHYGILASPTPSGKWLIIWDKLSPSQQKQYGEPPVDAVAAELIEIVEVAT